MESATQFNHDALKHDALNSGALQVICEMLPAAVLVTNDEGKSLFQNQAVSDVLGEGEANFSLSLGWYLPDGTTVLSPEESPVVRALRGEEIRDELFCRKNRQHLPGVWIRVTGSAIRNAAGRITSA